MEVNNELVDKLATLAKLSFTEIEKESIKNDLQKLIVFIEKMAEVDTADVEPLLHITSAKNIFREDKIQGTITVNEALKNATINDGEFFKVPTVIKK